jgi:hypothetical protein
VSDQAMYSLDELREATQMVNQRSITALGTDNPYSGEANRVSMSVVEDAMYAQCSGLDVIPETLNATAELVARGDGPMARMAHAGVVFGILIGLQAAKNRAMLEVLGG